MDQFTEDDFRQSCDNLRRALLPHAICIFTAPERNAPPKEWGHQATGTLVMKRGVGPLLVTARHVYDCFCRLRSRSPGAVMALGGLGNLTVLDSVEPLGHRGDVDAIAVRLAASFDPAPMERRFACLGEWFPRVVTGERCVFTGVPIEHTDERAGELDLHWALLDLRATEVTSAEIILAPDPEGKRVTASGDAISDAPGDWPGMSGAGLYALRGQCLEFAGVVYGGSGYGNDTTFRAYHADLIPLG